ncbi:MAG: hypothetical protein O9346_15145 [Leptospiraceae bacterium]|nr:hypothetical protein [Leptospiraceae bacterium]MCZ8347751.1 hypothetical protein [Leptospiraceae bacterium]
MYEDKIKNLNDQTQEGDKLISPIEFIECFASQSKLFKYSTLPTKIDYLNSYFSKQFDRNVGLFISRSEIMHNHNLVINEDEFIIACAIYLDTSFVHGLILNPIEKIVYNYQLSFFAMKDGRNKITKILDNKFLITRSLFDLCATEGNSSSLEQKREKLSVIYEKDNILPSQVFFYHIHSYRSQPYGGRNYKHVLNEAPYSAFAICFSKLGFILPDIKQYYNQSSRKERLIQLDLEKYKMS